MAVQILFDQDRCKGCELCTAVCPRGVIRIDSAVTNRKGYHPAAAAEPDRCVACGNCARICPDSIITVIRL
ncbi:MAG: 2-oxoacid:acceptor oxidoreductase [Oscillospiraceae bacterium]|nr:MAG: 2-oxoacid:acceptor oxidoreductase [Oscillospiraceae bacterium]